MRLRLAPVLAGLLAVSGGVNALRIPTHIVARPVEQLAKVLHASEPQAADLICDGCEQLFPGTKQAAHEGYKFKIRLEFDADNDLGLLINGRSVLPVFGDPFPEQLEAHILKTDDTVEIEDVGAYRLSFALERLEPVKSENEEEMLTPIRFTVLAVGGESVKVDTVSIHLLRTAEELIVMNVDTIPFEGTPGSGSCDDASSWSLCRLAAIVKARLATVMATAKAHAQKGWHGCHKHRHGKHGHHKKHGHHRHHWRAHRIGHLIHQTIRFFVIPALLGVIGGLMASAVGMLVGQIIVALWIKFRRGGRRGNASQQARLVEVVVVEDEKHALLEDDLPPQYEILPQYQDAKGAEELQ